MRSRLATPATIACEGTFSVRQLLGGWKFANIKDGSFSEYFHVNADYVKIPRLAWGVGMGDKPIRTGLCPGGRERMARLIRLLEVGRVDPRPMTTHRFPFDQVDQAFRLMETKEDGIIKPLISFHG